MKTLDKSSRYYQPLLDMIVTIDSIMTLKPENQVSSNAFNVSEYYVDINFRDSEQPWARVGGFSIKRVGPGRRSQHEFLFRHINNFRDAIEKFEEILKEKNIKF